MKLIQYLLVLVFCQFTLLATAQIGSTFRVGLTFPRFMGDSEVGPDGVDLEEFTSFTGFHVSGGVVFKMLDHYGLKAELMYTQKGSRYRYEGPSTYIFTTTTSGNYAYAVGNRTINNRITNSYLELPVTAYMKYGKFELNAGAHIGFLVSSKGVGDFQFNGISGVDNTNVEISSLITHNYNSDNLESAAEILTFQEEFYKIIEVDGQDVVLLTEETAYAQFTDVDGTVYGTEDARLEEKMFRGIDYGIHAGFSYYLSEGLFIGITAEYGLRDVTNPYFEYSLSESQQLERVPRSDFDRNFVIMGSVGFGF